MGRLRLKSAYFDESTGRPTRGGAKAGGSPMSGMWRRGFVTLLGAAAV